MHCPNCGADIEIEGFTVWTFSCSNCGHSGGGTAYFGPLVEDDDRPILIVRVVDPGRDRAKVFQLYRKHLGAAPDQAKALLDALNVEVARGSRMEVEQCIKSFEAAGATVDVTVAQSAQ